MNAKEAPATRQKKPGPADSPDFHPDSPEQIAESVDRTGLRDEISRAFRAAIARARQAVEELLLLGLVPGQCHICHRLGM